MGAVALAQLPPTGDLNNVLNHHCLQPGQCSHGLLWHLAHEIPCLGKKLTPQSLIADDLLDFIRSSWLVGEISNAFQALRSWTADWQLEKVQSLLRERKQGLKTDTMGWWHWMHFRAAFAPLEETMETMHCDGLIDWSYVPHYALASQYCQLIVTSGPASPASTLIDKGESWIGAVHQDNLPARSLNSFINYYCSGGWVDTLLVGAIGRKRVILMPPDALFIDSEGKLNASKSEVAFRAIKAMPFLQGRVELEKFAMNVGGAVFTLDSLSYCLIPAGWWHAVLPIDDFTVIMSPSFMRGSWSNLLDDEC